MSVASVVTQINAATLAYAPLVLAQVASIEVSAAGLPGPTKKEIVINSVLAGAHIAEGVPFPAVAGIGQLVDLFVSILRAAGVFKSHPKAGAPELDPPPAPLVLAVSSKDVSGITNLATDVRVVAAPAPAKKPAAAAKKP